MFEMWAVYLVDQEENSVWVPYDVQVNQTLPSVRTAETYCNVIFIRVGTILVCVS